MGRSELGGPFPCQEDDLVLTYTNDDDGVWIDCGNCEFRHNLGHLGRLADVQQAVDGHVQA